MNIYQYLIVKKTGTRYSSRYSSRLTSKSPALASNEIAVRIALELPDAIFDKPEFEAKIVVPEGAVSKPVIEADVIDNVEEIIKKNTGFEVKLTLVEPENEEKL